MFWAFTTGHLEKCFSKLRQGLGGTYCITAQFVIEEVRIWPTKLFLHLNLEVEGTEGHSCAVCTRELSENEVKVVNNLIVPKVHVARDVTLASVYIAGYVQTKANCKLKDGTFFYCDNYG